MIRRHFAVMLSYMSDGFHWCGHKLWAAALRTYPPHSWPLRFPNE